MNINIKGDRGTEVQRSGPVAGERGQPDAADRSDQHDEFHMRYGLQLDRRGYSALLHLQRGRLYYSNLLGCYFYLLEYVGFALIQF